MNMLDPSNGLIESAKSTVSISLDSQPSCCEFAKSHNILVVGTYSLESGQINGQETSHDATDTERETPAQNRTGSILVFHITKQRANLLQTKALPYALLDLHFSPRNPSIFAVATSVGSVSLFSLDFARDSNLMFIRSVQVCDSSILVLSLAYQVQDSIRGSPLIAVSLSNGHLAVFDEEQDEQDIVTFPVHSQEAWTVTWSKAPEGIPASPGSLYSGGDDSILCKHIAMFPHRIDEREAGIDQYQSLSRDSKTHGAGVTAIVVLPISQGGREILLTGSYDEYIRVVALPLHGRGRADILVEKHLGGGVWRISSPFAQITANGDSTNFKVLASCMHAGASILDIQAALGIWSIKVLAMFTEHESMNYASDILPNEENDMFVSTSFYDRKLCIWNISGASSLSSDVQQRP